MKFVSLGPRACDVRPKSNGSCHDCAAPVDGKYCNQCGQSSHVHVASAGEFIHHFIGHFVAAESKLWRTLGDLLLHPGQLTVDFIRGRRTRHIDPLRLLLTMSVLVFAMLKLQTLVMESTAKERASISAPQAEARQARSPMTQMIAGAFERVSPTFKEKLGAYDALPAAQRAEVFWKNVQKFGSTMILCLIPLVALFLKVLNAGTGWRYGEHLVFSIHLHAFLLLLFQAWIQLEPVVPHMATVSLLVLALYTLIALRRMYGGSWPVLMVRWAGLVYLELKALYAFATIAFFISL